MLPYFPPGYPDELLYSLLARFHRHVGETSPKRTLDVLFGNRSVRAGVLLQGHLQALSERLPPHRELTPGRLLADFTLYPYLTAFQPADVRLAVRDALFLGHAEWVTVRLGLAASRVQGATGLRYCPACRSDMLNLYGELYWRRDHQLPGVAVCPDHGVRLQDSTVCPGTIGQHSFIAADEDNCPKVSSDVQDDVSIPWMVVKRCARLLRSPPAPMSLREWGAHYHNELRQRGFGKGDDRIDQRRLSADFASWSGEPEMGGTENWLAAMARKHRKAFHPLEHVLLGLFLDAHAPVAENAPFGLGPWPCRNPLSEHYGQPVVQLAGTHQEEGKLIGQFSCSCGYVFSLAAVPGSKPRILDLGPLFRQRLRQLVAEGAGLRATARALGVDPGTIRRHAERLGLDAPWAPLKSRPHVPRSPRAACPQPPPPDPVPRRDWPGLDGQLCGALRAESERIKTLSPPIRASATVLQRQFGRRDWLASRLSKLPMTACALAEEAESVEQFRLRRIVWAAEELRRRNLPLKPWRLRRLAGLPEQASSQVEAALEAYEGL
ncbi:TnsD family Tn7-like transposition protein [Magnetospirillum aberrantis]|uniref:Transposase n=1 Tax=Magnetospirillum aberrantis SpK TaxID=908842 RepID=A0A7C9UZ33_9PROT|nr:TnsD family Tn7-like transposition protein [Magnetospirillum aberrantis]NFV80375.1 transposase [Magnetospirillum aberrantis SpK]